MKPRLLHPTVSFLPCFGGQENCILSLALRHAEAWDVHILAHRGARAFHGRRYRVHRLWPRTWSWTEQWPRFGRRYLWWQLERLQRRFRFAVWHAHFSNPFGQFTVAYALRHDIPCVWAMHGVGCLNELPPFFAQLSRFTSASRTPRLALDVGSRFLADAVNALGGPRCHAIPRGVDHERFARAEPAVLHDRHRVELIAVARNTPDKRLGLLIQAMQILVQRGRQDFGLTIVTHTFGSLANGVEQSGLAGHVRLLRTADLQETSEWRFPPTGVIRRLKAADIFVSLSRYEASPNVILEAFASGLPVLVSDIPAHRELVQDGVSGRIVADDTPSALADAIVALADDEAGRRRMAEQARRASQAFDWEKTARSYDELYRRVMAGDPAVLK